MPTLVPHNDPYDNQNTNSGNGISDDHLRPITGIGKNEEDSIDKRARSPEELEDAENNLTSGPFGASEGFGKELGRLRDIPQMLGKGYIPAGPANLAGGRAKLLLQIANALWGTKKRKQVTTTSGISGLIIAAAMTVGTIGTGPLEFIHLSQLLAETYMTQNEETADNRLGKLLRYARSEPPQNLRVSKVTAWWLDRVDVKLRAAGFERSYRGSLGFLDGYNLLADGSEFKGKYAEDVAQKFRDMGLKDSDFTLTADADGKITGGYVSADAVTRPRSFILKFERYMFGTISYKRVMGPLDAWNATKRNGSLSILHPIKKAENRFLDWVDRMIAFRKQQAEDIQGKNAAARVTATPDTDKETGEKVANPDADSIQSDTNTVSDAVAETAQQTANKPGALASIRANPAFKVGAGALGIAGVACLAYGLSEQVDALTYERIVIPLQRIYIKFMALGEQIKAGMALAESDLSFEDIGLYVRLMRAQQEGGGVQGGGGWNNSTAPDDDAWSAPPLAEAANLTPPTGMTTPEELTNVGQQNAITRFLASDAVQSTAPVCEALASPVGNVANLVIMAATAPFSGAIQMALAGPVMQLVASLLAGRAIDEQSAGVVIGYYLAHGGAYMGNEIGAMNAGRKLTNTEDAEWKQHNALVLRERFQEKSFAQRMFNPFEAHSLAARTIRQVDPSVKQNLSHFAAGFMNISKTFANLGTNIFSTKSAFAAGAITYDDGIDNYGFSLTELRDPNYENPLDEQRLTRVQQILDESSALPNQISGAIFSPSNVANMTNKTRLELCTGGKVIKDPDGEWTYWAGAKGGANVYAKVYEEYNCDSTDPDYMALRYWAIDDKNANKALCFEKAGGTVTQEMINYACALAGMGGDPMAQNASFNGAIPIVNGEWTWPADTQNVTQAYKGPSTHNGVDIAANSVVAAHAGVVTKIIPSPGKNAAGVWQYNEYGMSGTTIVVAFNDGNGNTVETLYDHQGPSGITVGQSVTLGQPIGVYDGSGRTTGAHVHFAIFINGQAVDPMPYITSSI